MQMQDQLNINWGVNVFWNVDLNTSIMKHDPILFNTSNPAVFSMNYNTVRTVHLIHTVR
jgi:hypothetical protein